MIDVNNFFAFLKKNKIKFFSGVPDSVLKDTKEIFEKMSNKNHMIAANEGVATSICIGNYLATGTLPCVYLQNSGLGNAVNPLISVAHKKVYSIPLLLLIGWRGAPGLKDEPQHIVKGKITKKLLLNMGIRYCELINKKDLNKLKKLIIYSKKNKSPIACLVKKSILFKPKKNKKIYRNSGVKRWLFIEKLLETINKKTKIISSTGYISRELQQIRKNKKINIGKDFYMVGGMGHSSSVALGFSISKSKNKVICLDGDGALLMHLGSMANVGFYGNKNFKHIVLNNNCHESVGGQKTNMEKVKLKQISLGLGYKNYSLLSSENKIISTLKNFLTKKGPSLLEVKIQTGSINNLSRPKNLIVVKNNFMKTI